ncbi:MAG: lysine--tRNA ligase [Candidatus Omnitrophica bacterium]|nr:lysine--tRNA ligase [Candidatus Omnitrophota bacterium]
MQERLAKLNKIREMGVEPYGNKFVRSHNFKQLLEDFKENKEVRVSGRIMALRGHGKAGFLDIQDINDRMQVYVKKDNLSEDNFLLFKNLDIGDIIGLEGSLFITRKEEKSIKAANLFLLSKSLKPLPEKWHGLKDTEIRYRRRCLDLITNSSAKRVFLTRSKIINQIREFLKQREFIEVETPMLQSLAGGAKAKPFVTHYNSLNCDVYLRIAPELYLKRLLVGGLEKIYELNRSFRNEGISAVHNPEFTMLEVYESYADYKDMMRLSEELIIDLANRIYNSENVEWRGKQISLKPPWARVPFYDTLKKETGIDFQDKNLDFKKAAMKLGVVLNEDLSPSDILNNIFDKFVQPKLIEPTFVTDYPTFLCPLARAKKDMPQISERFEVFVGGQELANGYSELNDPLEQRRRFEEQGGEIDEDFLAALEQGMPPAGGLGIGIDRLIMLLTNKNSIREVLLFPQLKPLKG